MRNEPVLAQIAAGITVHRLHGEQGTVVHRGRAAGIAYLTHRAQQAIIAAMWAKHKTSAGAVPATQEERKS